MIDEAQARKRLKKMKQSIDEASQADESGSVGSILFFVIAAILVFMYPPLLAPVLFAVLVS